MRFGLALPHYDFSLPGASPVTGDGLAAAARRAEALGFDSVWVSDHFYLSLERYGGPSVPYGTPEPLLALAALAGETERVRLGTLVLSSGFRHPALVAKAAATVDLLSEGRLDLGVGAGWYEEEYRAFGYPFGDVGERFDVLEETVEVLVRLFEEGPATWRGRRFRLEEAYNHPTPAQSPRPPVWIGGKGGPRLLRLVADRADGWNTVWAWALDAYAERVAALERISQRLGRDPGTVRRSVGLYLLLGEGEADVAARHRRFADAVPGGLPIDPPEAWRADRLAGTPDEVLERVAAFADLGVEEVIVSPAAVPFAIHDHEMVELFAERVIPEGRSL